MIRIQGHKQLFIDHRWIDQSEGVDLRVNPPAVGPYVLQPEHPWEAHAIHCYNTVIYDSGLYRMWYDACSDLPDDPPHGRSLCYAESDDGVHWRKPMVNVMSWPGCPQNNIVMCGCESAAVFVDPHDEPARRYKALTILRENEVWSETRGVVYGPHSGKTFKDRWLLCMYLCTSPDGIHWTRTATPASDYFHDSQNILMFDERMGSYVAYVRMHDPKRGRAMGRIEVAAPNALPWIPLETDYEMRPKWRKRTHYFPCVIHSDDDDPPGAQVYGAAVHQYPWADDVYLAFANMFLQCNRDDSKEFANGAGHDGVTETQLFVSRDGVSWDRPQRDMYVGRGGPGEDDAGGCYMAQGMVRSPDGREIYMYSAALPLTHAQWNPGKTRTFPGLRILRQRLDGFVCATAEYGRLTTPPYPFGGGELNFNLIGNLRTAIVDENNRPIPGFTFEDAIPIDGDHLRAAAVWRSGRSIGELQDRPVRLSLELRNCQLFAFQFATSRA